MCACACERSRALGARARVRTRVHARALLGVGRGGSLLQRGAGGATGPTRTDKSSLVRRRGLGWVGGGGWELGCSEVLEGLAAKGYEVAGKVNEWRQVRE